MWQCRTFFLFKSDQLSCPSTNHHLRLHHICYCPRNIFTAELHFFYFSTIIVFLIIFLDFVCNINYWWPLTILLLKHTEISLELLFGCTFSPSYRYNPRNNKIKIFPFPQRLVCFPCFSIYTTSPRNLPIYITKITLTPHIFLSLAT